MGYAIYYDKVVAMKMSFYLPKDDRAYALIDRIDAYSQENGLSRNMIMWRLMYEGRRKLRKVIDILLEERKKEDEGHEFRARTRFIIRTPREQRAKTPKQIKQLQT